MDIHSIHSELQRFVMEKFRVDSKLLADDPTFEDMNADSMTRLEILLHGDDTFGSHVLDYIEDGLLQGEPPIRLSELAALIPQCMTPAQEIKAAAKNAAAPEMRG